MVADVRIADKISLNKLKYKVTVKRKHIGSVSIFFALLNMLFIQGSYKTSKMQMFKVQALY